jgi:glycosidase
MDWYVAEAGPGMTNWHKPANRYNAPGDGISVEEQRGKNDSLLEYYRALVSLRNANPALRTGAIEKIDPRTDAFVYAYLRQDSAAAFVVVLNFGDQPMPVTLDLAATSLPDGHYVATDALSKRTFDLDGLTLKLNLDAASGHVLQLARR